MKKIFLLVVFFPLFLLSQSSLVKWYQSDFSPSLLISPLDAAKLKKTSGNITNEAWGADNIFYSTDGWPSPSYTNPPSPVFDSNNYLQFSVGPLKGYKVMVSRFVFSGRIQSGTAKMQIRYSKFSDFSSYSVLQEETTVNSAYAPYNLSFPSGFTVNSGEYLYIRVYIYSTHNNFHIKHNAGGSIAPALEGTVLLTDPQLPLAKDDFSGTFKNIPVNLNVLENDDYRFSGPLKEIGISKGPENGTVKINGITGITYTPSPGFVGYDSFYYLLTNEKGVSKTPAKVEIQVLDGTGQVLTRWKSSDYTATDYRQGAFGLTMTKSPKMNLVSNAREGFQLSALPTPQQFDGGPDPEKYVQVGIKVGNNEDFTGVLKSFNLQYRTQAGTGELTVKYSKNADFSGNIYTLLDGGAVTADYTTAELKFSEAAFVYPGETVYIRIYGHNTYNTVFLKYTPSSEEGPTVMGTVATFTPEPCSKTAIWSGSAWSIPPSANTRVVLNGDYDTAKYGTFEACSLTMNAGKLKVASGNYLKVLNEIALVPQATIEVQNDANLLQVNDNAIPNRGTISVFRDIKIGIARNQYNYLGSPVVFVPGEGLKTIYPGIDFVLYYNEGNSFFYSSSGANIPGRGLAVKEPKAEVASGRPFITAQFKGVPQNGPIAFPVTNSTTPSNTALGFNLLGNPYPSDIDAKKLYELNRGNASAPYISATFYFWDNRVNNDVAQAQQGTAYNGQAYAIFNAAAGSNGTGTAASGYLTANTGSAKIPNRFIKTGQGFMVRSLVKNYIFQYNNSIRTSQGTGIPFLGKGSAADIQDDRYWLNMVSPAGLTSTLAVVHFVGGMNAFGEEDSESKGGSDEIFTLVDGKNLSINGRASFSNTDFISLGTRHFVSGSYTIGIERTEGLFAVGQAIYLKDRDTGIITDLSKGNYTFTAKAGERTGRFEILYKTETNLTTDHVTKENIKVYKNEGNFVVETSSEKITVLEVFDRSGRLIYRTAPESTQAVIVGDLWLRGMYIIKIVQNERVTSRRILK